MQLGGRGPVSGEMEASGGGGTGMKRIYLHASSKISKIDAMP